MPVQRVWLGWDQPVLPTGARWLFDQYATSGSEGAPGQWDLSSLNVVLPTARAGRRLLECLVSLAEGRLLVPPKIQTVGQLPELLYEAAPAVADSLTMQLTWVEVLQQADAEHLALLTGRGNPTDSPVLGVLDAFTLADDLLTLRNTLEADLQTPGDAAEASQGSGARWEAIAALTLAYENRLAQHGMVDLHLARRAARDRGGCRALQSIVLMSCVDLPTATQRMLETAEGPITALIAAPLAEADAFGSVGQLQVDAWADRPIDLEPTQLQIVDRPQDQARAVIQAIARRAGDHHTCASSITIGLGDETLAPSVVRALAQEGIAAHVAAGQPAQHSRPARLLEAVARYLRNPRFDGLAALLRHPDVQGQVEGVASWLTLMDRYLTDHVQGQVTGVWLGPQAAQLKAVFDQVHAWLPDEPGRRRGLSQWADPLAQMLTQIYGQHTLQRHDHADATLLRSLTALRDALLSFQQLDAHWREAPRVTADEAILLLLHQLEAQTLPTEPADDAIEVVGFLEMGMDDAPLAVVAGVNEGALPSSLTSDPLLPNGLRQTLGMMDNRHRLARDVYVMTLLLRTRPGATLIAGRRSNAGDPLMPSRLLLRSDPHTIAQRLTDFYDDTPLPWLPPRLACLTDQKPPLQMIAPRLVSPPLQSLRVTGFRDYLTCPYRFYLKHVLKLKTIDDRAVEMSGMSFGNLAHHVLLALGQSDLAASTEPEPIQAFLHDRLEAEVKNVFGSRPTATVVLQARQLRQRLDAFAHWQAQSVRDGWRIMADHLEVPHEMSLAVDGIPFVITGTLDRIDQHPVHGYRVIDYKTADAGHTPDQTHRKKEAWIDLQLPLYDALARAAGLSGSIELGYMLLPRDLKAVGFAASGWDASQVQAGLDEAARIIRAIRRGQYWPPSQPPEFDDGFQELCYDRAMDRPSLIEVCDEA